MMVTSSTTRKAMWLRKVLHELSFLHHDVIVIFSDNQGSLALIKNPIHHKRTKHIDIQHHYVKEMMNAKEMFFQYCPTLDMGTNVLTKSVLTPKHSKCMQLLGWIDDPLTSKA
jgi:hypothetical protein